MRAGPKCDRSQHGLFPPVRLGMAIGVGKNARILVMHGAGSCEVTLRVGDRYLKRGVTDTGWFHIYEHKQGCRPPKFRRTLVKCYWRDGSKLFHPAVQVIIHRIAAQLRDAPDSHAIDSPFGGTPVNCQSLQVSREPGSFGINNRIGIDEAWSGSMDRALDPIESASGRRIAAHIRWKAATIVILVESPGETQLLVIIDALDSQRSTFRSGKGRQQQGRENGDDCDDNQQLDQCETAALGWSQHRRILIP